MPDHQYYNLNVRTVQLEEETGSCQYLVEVEYCSKISLYNPETARDLGKEIILAVAIAQNEEAIYRAFETQNKGFAPKNPNSVAVKMLRILRGKRPKLKFGLDVIFGFKSEKGLVVMKFDDLTTNIEPETALTHAQRLLEAAEAAQTDEFLYKFMEEECYLGSEKDEFWSFMVRFQLFRQRALLEKSL